MSLQNSLDDSSFELLVHAAKNFSWDGTNLVTEEIQSFLKQVHSALDPTSLDLFRLDDIASMSREFWDWTADRSAGSLVRIRSALDRNGQKLGYSVLEICGPDMPFIVRSVTGACLDMNINPVLVIHPIMQITRDENGLRGKDGTKHQESFVQIYMDMLDSTASDALYQEVKATLSDIAMCVADYSKMRKRMQHAAIDVLDNKFVDENLRKEASDFLNWLADEHFTFLGSREYNFPISEGAVLAQEEPETIDGSSLGILRDEDRYILRRGHEPTIITQQISEFLHEPEPVIVAKGSMSSRVHRRVRVDYIGVKRYNDNGEVVGEVRFAGLFTADAYNRMTRDVPMLREKVNRVVQRAEKLPGSHDESALKHIMETYPRDELFQIGEDEIFQTALAILQLQTRNETRLFVRKDRFDRFISALVFVPKESFNTDLRARIANVLCTAFNGTLTAFYPLYGDAPLARIHYLIDLEADHNSPNLDRLEEEISRVARSWNDQMRGLIRAHRSELLPQLSENVLTNAFSAAYKEAFDPEEGLTDIEYLSGLSDNRPVLLRAFRMKGDEANIIRAKIYSFDEPVELSNCVPVFENMGLFVVSETGYPVKINGGNKPFWVHDVRMRGRNGLQFSLPDVKSVFEDAFEAIWTDRSVSDGFNRLVLSNGMSWREAALFRTFARYRKQTGLDPSQTLQIQALVTHQDITKCLLDIFKIRFDPDLDLSESEREAKASALRKDIAHALDKVESLDEDRVLRRFDELLAAIKRTNFYQLNAHFEPFDHIAIKIASREIANLPNPKPYREIFVWAPHVEGVHLRFGPVARGGLRWSDRQDDFRTEVLGLVKAQQVKNAVIVPVGSKGGFFPKKLPKTGDRDAIQQEGIRAYRTFIGALLQLTDNLIDGEPRHPDRTIVWEGNDPYLVVAADKGTATFSDIANEISTSLGFWLGDAFASGGSAGYDHKKMGITARGAWVAVQRHFREIGVNVQSDPIDVIGVGDMSGDVFGNGMLLSKCIRLKAAFNHMHIFIDPNPTDLDACWEERKRLFDTPRTSWADYSESLISKGGGVFSRSAKSIDLTPEIKDFLNVEDNSLTPQQLMQAILKAKADLLWFGGIGTYIKAKSESNADAGDKANDAIRINADDLKVKVVGEGANLGVTQAGRIAFARRGGRINSDAIDNSAGVDSSDHEVNIKILLKNAISSGLLKEEDRNDLLASMTDEVAELVLVHNYDQTEALTVAQASAIEDLDSHERMMELLEASSILDRDVEMLPKPEEVRALKQQKLGLTRPELAVLLAYAKITLFDEIIATDIPDESYLEKEAFNYFPHPVQKFDTAVQSHRLKREIIATRLSNDIVNLGGITFVHRVKERAGVDTAPVIKAFVAADQIFGLRDIFKRIDALDYKVPASTQTKLRLDLINALRRQVFWLAKAKATTASIQEIVDEYQSGVRDLLQTTDSSLSPFEQSLLSGWVKSYVDAGAPEDISKAVASVCAMTSATDIVELAERQTMPPTQMALLFSAVGDRFRFDKLRHQAMSLKADQHWDRLATRGMVETLLGQQETLAERLAGSAKGHSFSTLSEALETTDRYISGNHASFERLMALVNDIEKAGSWSFAKLVLVTNALRGFIEETDLRAS